MFIIFFFYFPLPLTLLYKLYRDCFLFSDCQLTTKNTCVHSLRFFFQKYFFFYSGCLFYILLYFHLDSFNVTIHRCKQWILSAHLLAYNVFILTNLYNCTFFIFLFYFHFFQISYRE